MNLLCNKIYIPMSAVPLESQGYHFEAMVRTAGHMLAVVEQVSGILDNMPPPKSEEYFQMTELPLESIRNAGMHAVEFSTEAMVDFLPTLYIIVDVLTTLRYGVDDDGDVDFIETAMVGPRNIDLEEYPVWLVPELIYGLRVLNDHWSLFVESATSHQIDRLEAFERSLQLLVEDIQSLRPASVDFDALD